MALPTPSRPPLKNLISIHPRSHFTPALRTSAGGSGDLSLLCLSKAGSSLPTLRQSPKPGTTPPNTAWTRKALGTQHSQKNDRSLAPGNSSDPKPADNLVTAILPDQFCNELEPELEAQPDISANGNLSIYEEPTFQYRLVSTVEILASFPFYEFSGNRGTKRTHLSKDEQLAYANKASDYVSMIQGIILDEHEFKRVRWGILSAYVHADMGDFPSALQALFFTFCVHFPKLKDTLGRLNSFLPPTVRVTKDGYISHTGTRVIVSTETPLLHMSSTITGYADIIVLRKALRMALTLEMFMNYTISEDRTSCDGSEQRARLCALREESRRGSGRFLNRTARLHRNTGQDGSHYRAAT